MEVKKRVGIKKHIREQLNLSLFVQRGQFMVPLVVFRCHTASEKFTDEQGRAQR